MTSLLAAQAAGGSIKPFIIMMIAIFAIMWILMIHPEQKKRKEIRNFQNHLKEGDKIMTSGGIYGTVKSIDNEKNIINVEIARGVVIPVDRNYVFSDINQSCSESLMKE